MRLGITRDTRAIGMRAAERVGCGGIRVRMSKKVMDGEPCGLQIPYFGKWDHSEGHAD